MNPLTRSNNLAARMGRWSAGHWKTATVTWLAFVATAFVLGGALGTHKLSDAGTMNGESARAERTIAHAGFGGGSSEAVLVQSRALRASDASFEQAVAELVTALENTGRTSALRTPYVSADGHSALITFELRGRAGDSYDGVEHALRAVAAVQRAHPQLRIEEAGDASLDKALDDTVEKDFKRAELFSIPLTLGILLVAFGALVAALVPLTLALTAFLGALGLVAFMSRLVPMDDAASSVMLLIGLAVGVDYSLFYLKREREERALGKSADAALEAAAATSGRSVLISGMTVIVAMAGMFLAGNRVFSGVGLATITVVAIAVVGSLTVLPALLSRLGDRIERGRIPLLHRFNSPTGESRLWGAVLRRVLARPLAAAAVAGGLLVALAVPAFGLHTSIPGADDLPQRLSVIQTHNRIQAAFPGSPAPARVAVTARSVDTTSLRSAFAELRSQIVARGIAHEPITVDVNPSRTVAVVSVPLVGSGAGSPRSEQALVALRHVVGETIGQTGAHAAVGGEVAESKDFNDSLKTHAPLVFGFVLGLAFLLLLVTFRSLVIAATAIVLNLLSVAGAYGLLVLVFQRGLGESILGFESNGAIISWLPLFLFVVLFGLSMDYHVFIISRIKEAYGRGLSTEEAIAHGIKSSAGVVTAAATVMIFVFAIFATLSKLSMKELGVGLAAAVLIDATLIRGVLLPATMKLLGRANWYFPRRLEWLPRLTQEPGASRLEPALDAPGSVR